MRVFMSNKAAGDAAAGGLDHILGSNALQEHCSRKIITSPVSLFYPS